LARTPISPDSAGRLTWTLNKVSIGNMLVSVWKAAFSAIRGRTHLATCRLPANSN
jgi:hypothetical protein